MHSAKQRFYEALEKQSRAERTLEQNLTMGGKPMSEHNDDATPRNDESVPFEHVYHELGIKTMGAVVNILDIIGQWGPRRHSEALRPAELEHMLDRYTMRAGAEMDRLHARLDAMESQLTSIEAALKRIDRFTIEAFRELEDLKRDMPDPSVTPAVDRGRLSKEEAIQMALDAGRSMVEQGRRITLASVAREAGLKYGQIVYAFGNKEQYFSDLEASLQDTMTAADHQAG